MIDFRKGQFNQQAIIFKHEKETYKIKQEADELRFCKGPAIDKRNECFAANIRLSESFNRVYNATDLYLFKVSHNINACEAENTGN